MGHDRGLDTKFVQFCSKFGEKAASLLECYQVPSMFPTDLMACLGTASGLKQLYRILNLLPQSSRAVSGASSCQLFISFINSRSSLAFRIAMHSNVWNVRMPCSSCMRLEKSVDVAVAMAHSFGAFSLDCFSACNLAGCLAAR